MARARCNRPGIDLNRPESKRRNAAGEKYHPPASANHGALAVAKTNLTRLAGKMLRSLFGGAVGLRLELDAGAWQATARKWHGTKYHMSLVSLTRTWPLHFNSKSPARLFIGSSAPNRIA